MSDLCLKCGNPAYLPSDQCDVIWHTEAKSLTDRIEELEAELNYYRKDSADAWDKCEENRLKLVKAVEALVRIADMPSEMTWGVDSEVREAMNGMEIIAETTLTKLKDEK